MVLGVLILQHLRQFCRGARAASIQKVGERALRKILDFTLRQGDVTVGRYFGCWNGSGVACESASSARFISVLTGTGENANLKRNDCQQAEERFRKSNLEAVNVRYLRKTVPRYGQI